MSYSLSQFRPWHVEVLAADGEPYGGLYLPDPAILRYIERAPNSRTLFYDDLPVASGGTMLEWPGRHMAWAFIANTAGPHMLMVTRIARDIVASVPGRVEMTVRADFDMGHRWAKMLGFEVETPRLKAYGPTGEDHVGYVRINGD